MLMALCSSKWRIDRWAQVDFVLKPTATGDLQSFLTVSCLSVAADPIVKLFARATRRTSPWDQRN